MAALLLMLLLTLVCFPQFGIGQTFPRPLGPAEGLSIQFARFSTAAYCPQSTLSGWTCARCQSASSDFVVKVVAEDTTHNVQGFVGYTARENIVVAAYRGTQETSLRNWITNLDAFQTKTAFPGAPAGAEVHKGFFDAYSGATHSSMVGGLTSLMNAHPNARIVVTGHSLGGALADFLAVEIYFKTGVHPDLYTYGQPRDGNTNWASYVDSLNANRTRWTHYNDIVPHLPPMAFDFHHIATEFWTNSPNTAFKQCNGSGEDPSCSDSIATYDYTVSAHLDYLGVAMGGTTGC